jgi:hypothetical protein
MATQTVRLSARFDVTLIAALDVLSSRLTGRPSRTALLEEAVALLLKQHKIDVSAAEVKSKAREIQKSVVTGSKA